MAEERVLLSGAPKMKKSRKINLSFFIGYFISFFFSFFFGRGNVNVTHKLGSFYAGAVVGSYTVGGRR